MQDKKVNQYILIPVPLEDVIDAELDLSGIIQTTVADGKIIIETPDISGEYVCDGDCESCPLNETDCDGDCENCPCNESCDESEVE